MMVWGRVFFCADAVKTRFSNISATNQKQNAKNGIIMIPAYPIYRRIARKTKTELTPEILRLSEEIIKSAKN